MDNFESLSEKIINESEKILEMEETENDQSGQDTVDLKEQLELLKNMLQNQIEVKDEMIDKLHKELEYYRQGAADRFVDQLMKGIIKIRKDMLRLMASEKWGDMFGEDMEEEYQYIFEDLTDLLEQQNVDAYQSDVGDLFNPAIHQAKTEVTDDMVLDKTIKQSISEGYKRNGRVLMPEKVVVYQYKK